MLPGCGRERSRLVDAAGQIITILLFPQVLVEKASDLLEGLLRLRCAGVAIPAAMRLAFVDVQVRDHGGLAQLAVHAYGVAEQEVARPRIEDGRREVAHG